MAVLRGDVAQKKIKNPTRARDPEEILSPLEYDLFLRFLIGPPERFRSAKQRKQTDKVQAKITAEYQRAEKARYEWTARANKVLARFRQVA